MALAASSTQLGCGRDIDQVWDHLDRAPDAHELTCPYCQAARADLADLGRATRAMREADATDPDLEPSPGVLDRILEVARAEVRRGHRFPLDLPASEQTSGSTVSEQAVTAVVWRAGDRTKQVHIRRCRLTLGTRPSAPGARGAGAVDPDGQTRSPAAPLDPGPAAVEVSLQVSVSHDLAIADASDRLRAAIIDAVRQEVGLNVSSVHIAVEDLHDA